MGSYLALALPVLDVLDVAATTEVDVLAGADEHVWGGYDIRNRRVLGVLARDPDCDGDVVGRVAEGDGESAVETEQELGPPVVVRCGDG